MPTRAIYQRLSNLIKFASSNNYRLIKEGEFNACNPAWCSKVHRHGLSRGEILLEFLVDKELTLENQGFEPTWSNFRASSTIDLTFSNPIATKVIQGWSVDTEESMSDHTYIYFEIDEFPMMAHMVPTRNFRKVDWSIFGAAVDDQHITCAQTSTLTAKGDLPRLNGRLIRAVSFRCKKIFRRLSPDDPLIYTLISGKLSFEEA